MGKVIGAVLLMGCGAWIGLSAAGELRRRGRELEDWMAALALLEGEMAFSLADLPALLEGLSRRAPAGARPVFAAAAEGLETLGERSFGEIWTQALAAHPGGLAREDVETLDRLGEVLGRYGWEEQRASLRALLADLARRREEAGRELERKGRSYAAAGFALGAFGAILLL